MMVTLIFKDSGLQVMHEARDVEIRVSSKNNFTVARIIPNDLHFLFFLLFLFSDSALFWRFYPG